MRLLALCPNIPADVVAASLVRVRWVPTSPILGFRHAALWSLTDSGAARLHIERDPVVANSGSPLRLPLRLRLTKPSSRIVSAGMLASLSLTKTTAVSWRWRACTHRGDTRSRSTAPDDCAM